MELLSRLHDLFDASPKAVRFHIFSDGEIENFDRFIFTGEQKACLILESGLRIENIHFHLRRDAFCTLYHMVKAPVFVPGKSTFSVLAAILTNSCVLYTDEITEFHLYNILEKYIDGNKKFISLDGQKENIVAGLKALVLPD